MRSSPSESIYDDVTCVDMTHHDKHATSGKCILGRWTSIQNAFFHFLSCSLDAQHLCYAYWSWSQGVMSMEPLGNNVVRGRSKLSV